jgi:hypothetical protein
MGVVRERVGELIIGLLGRLASALWVWLGRTGMILFGGKRAIMEFPR